MTLPNLTPHERAVFSAVYALPGLNLRETARAAGVHEKRVQRLALRLERLGLLASERLPRRFGRLNGHVRLLRPADWTRA